MASMTRIRPGEPGHGGSSACLRRRPLRIINGVAQGGWTDLWEIICPACGDDIDLDYVTISPFLQHVRGPYASEAAGLAALRDHRGEAAAAAAAEPDSEQTIPNRILLPPETPAPAAEEPAGAGVTTDSGTGQRL